MGRMTYQGSKGPWKVPYRLRDSASGEPRAIGICYESLQRRLPEPYLVWEVGYSLLCVCCWRLNPSCQARVPLMSLPHTVTGG